MITSVANTAATSSSTAAIDEDLPLVSGTNVVLQSALLRMILVATSTVVSVTAIALFAIGISEINEPDADKDRNEPMVLAVGGALLLLTSVVQFITVCVWSGWCSVLPARGFRRLRRNQILVNGQLITIHPGAGGAGGTDTEEPSFQITSELENPAGLVLDPGPPLDTSSVKGSPALQQQQQPRPTNLSPPRPTKMDATTSTRGELVFLSPRGNYAPIALQEEITPSLRSSFQSFDELA